jgi:hypothetical protein
MNDNQLNSLIRELVKEEEIKTDNISDGYHTFGELYRHRIILYITLCKQLAKDNTYNVWRSEKHSDGSSYEGWFIMGVEYNGMQISYHINMSYWEQTNFAKTLDLGLPWDGHTSEDVLKRISEII